MGKINSNTVKSLGETVDTNELEWESRMGKNNKKTSKLSLAVDTNELEWGSRMGKINSKTSKIIRSGSRYKWVRVSVKSGED